MTDPTRHTLADLMADLDASDADIESGNIVPGEAVLAELEEQLARLEARLARQAGARATSR